MHFTVYQFNFNNAKNNKFTDMNVMRKKNTEIFGDVLGRCLLQARVCK